MRVPFRCSFDNIVTWAFRVQNCSFAQSDLYLVAAQGTEEGLWRVNRYCLLKLFASCKSRVRSDGWRDSFRQAVT